MLKTSSTGIGAETGCARALTAGASIDSAAVSRRMDEVVIFGSVAKAPTIAERLVAIAEAADWQTQASSFERADQSAE